MNSPPPRTHIPLDIQSLLKRRREEREAAAKTEAMAGCSESEGSMDLRDQIYQERMNALLDEYEQLENQTHPEYVKKYNKLHELYLESVEANNAWKDYLTECANQEHAATIQDAMKEFEEGKKELKEKLIMEVEEQKKKLTQQHIMMRSKGYYLLDDPPPISTRKLRRRPNDPPLSPEKKKKEEKPLEIVYQLLDKEIEDDLKEIRRLSRPGKCAKKQVITLDDDEEPSSGTTDNRKKIEKLGSTAKIQDGKLMYNKQWFLRGQNVFIEGKKVGEFPGIIASIRNDGVIINKGSDGSKVKVTVSQLLKGKVVIKRRAC